MRKFASFAWFATVLLVLLACSRGSSSLATSAATGNNGTPVAAVPHVAATRAMGAGRHVFASLPDHGELLAYAGSSPRQDGAYTWHRTQLSEAHALHAIADKHLRVTTPSGQILDIQYDRHEVHPSGDWTWIGHIDGDEGDQTILTFGADAAFGSIAQPGKLPLRLTVRNGVSWLVETDPNKIANVINSATHPRHPDYIIPPASSSSSATSGAMQAAASPATASATTASAVTTVDLVVGYTPAFASDNGGTSGAVTRLNYLVDVANAAYLNSQINAKVRLVGTVVVNYPDATSNDTTIDQLTGSDGHTSSTPNAAFNGLRAAREQYGADLVSFVRSFRDPENDGCGIGWLIGGGRQAFSTSASPFGYSVVSDGTDKGTDGKTYYCLDETLAHEMGHNMGAQHDIDTAKGSDGVLGNDEYGAFSYSFGYKSSVAVSGGASGYYTIMAYGDTGQRIYRIFSDPRSTFCGGHVCGTAQADNAQTLGRTITTVANFRATVVSIPPPSAPRLLLKELDTNGNGTSDLLLRSRTAGNFVTWFMVGNTRTAYSSSPLAGAYSLVGTGDLNGDHRTDLVWTSAARDVLISTSTTSNYTTVVSPYTYAAGYQIIGVADINGDGKADLLLRNSSTGLLVVWYMSGVNRFAYNSHNVAADYVFVGSGDLNKDGKQDLVWTSPRSDILVSTSLGTAFSDALVGLNYDGANYVLAGVTDVNGDGAADLILRSQALARVVTWFMSGTTRVAYSSKGMSSQYRLVAKGDFNGDHKGDLVWTDAADEIVISTSTGSNFADSLLPLTYASNYALMDAQ
jgi:hypothetical protein